jgi:thiamine biosynthesis lipoprotein
MHSSPGWGKSCLILLCALCACTGKPETRQLYVFGTIASIKVFGSDAETVDAAVLALEARYRALDRDWYPWRKAGASTMGQLEQINRAIAEGRSTPVEANLARLIRRGSELETATGGRFSIATGRYSELWGLNNFEASRPVMPAPGELAAAAPGGRASDVLQWEGDRLRSKSRNVVIDPGGIAKGTILALSRDWLLERGIRNAIVDIGGDLLVLGEAAGRPARIGIRSPRETGIVGWLDVADGEAVMTSGDYERFVEIDGKRFQHIIDPRSGHPVEHTMSATVVHKDPELADAAATALVVGGIDEFDMLCELLDLRFAMVIDASGDMRLTPALHKRVNWAVSGD